MLRRKLLFLFGGFVVLLLLFLILDIQRARKASTVALLKSFTRYPLVIAHADDTGIAAIPGNTMPFLRHIASQKVDLLEMDVCITKDHHIVLSHDDSIDRTTDRKGKIADLDLATIKKARLSVRWTRDGKTFPYKKKPLQIPTLQEVFHTFPHYPMNIELKQNSLPLAKELCRLIKKHKKQDQVMVASSRDQAMQAFRTACPEVATSANKGEAIQFLLHHLVGLTGRISPAYQALQIPEKLGSWQIVTPSFVRAAHARGVQVHVWTINHPPTMKKLLSMGVDGIMTDLPQRLFRVRQPFLKNKQHHKTNAPSSIPTTRP